MNGSLFLHHKGLWWEWLDTKQRGMRQHTPVFALKCRIKVCPIVGHASWIRPWLTVTGLIVPSFQPLCGAAHFSCVWGKREAAFWRGSGGVRGQGGGCTLALMKEQARTTNNEIPGLWSTQRQCCSNYSANTTALCVCGCGEVWTGGRAEGIALLAAVSQEPDYCKRRMCVWSLIKQRKQRRAAFLFFTAIILPKD